MPDSHIRETSSSYSLSTNRLIDEELSYHFVQLLHETSLSSTLNSDQLRAFNCIIDRVHNNKPNFFFVSSYGGTGKTYLWTCIVTDLRALKNIVLTVASSGIASLLLPRGVAHSSFLFQNSV
jgi:DNA replication protein DnaC